MAGNGFKVNIKLNDKKLLKDSMNVLNEALEDITDDLVQMSSQAAPVDEHILEGSHQVQRKDSNTHLERIVSYSSFDEGFDYALYVHNTHPIGGLGEKTKRKPPGQSGITGKTHPAGGMFLLGPLRLNEEGYAQYIAKKYDKFLDK